MTKEDKWLRKRLGMITASELGNITSASGKIIDGNLSYIRAKRWERKHGFSHPVTARAMDIGNEQEPMIYQWALTNLGFNEIVYSKDLPEIPFWISTDSKVGASPDAFVPSERLVFEFKTLVGATSIEFFGDEYTPYEEKKLAVWKDHGDQLLGQFLSNSAVEEIWLIKYIYQDDDIMADTDSPLAPWRGLVFKFVRKDYETSIDEMRERIRLIDAMIDAPINPSEFKKGEWFIDDKGQLRKK
ncbi:MAG: hypothetical protein J6T35_02455 [Bacteroidales bacterium]|nr:hypothetical protein [Bacteroidales bacterium]